MRSSKNPPARRSAELQPTRAARLAALRAETDREVIELIERLLAKPMHERTHFLRRRLPNGGSAL
jgi:hypothetical protein